MEALKKLIGPISNGRIDKNQAQKIGMKWRVDYRVSPSTGQFRLNLNMNFHSYKFYSFFYSVRQLFWIAAANIWCEKSRPESLTEDILTGQHSPSRFRVRGPFSNMAQFATDFDCPINSAMNPSVKCTVWWNIFNIPPHILLLSLFVTISIFFIITFLAWIFRILKGRFITCIYTQLYSELNLFHISCDAFLLCITVFTFAKRLVQQNRKTRSRCPASVSLYSELQKSEFQHSNDLW